TALPFEESDGDCVNSAVTLAGRGPKPPRRAIAFSVSLKAAALMSAMSLRQAANQRQARRFTNLSKTLLRFFRGFAALEIAALLAEKKANPFFYQSVKNVCRPGMLETH